MKREGSEEKERGEKGEARGEVRNEEKTRVYMTYVIVLVVRPMSLVLVVVFIRS